MLSKYVDRSSVKQYYNSYILPIFDYGCNLWGQCTTYIMNRWLKLQKRAARLIVQADFMTPSNQIFQELGWLTFSQRVQYHTCVMVFKSLNGQEPEYLTNLLTRSSETHGRSLRSNDKEVLKIPFQGLTIIINHLNPVKRICVFKHSVMTNFNCACPAIQRG